MTSMLIAILCISTATLGLEMVLIRALSIGQWYHFAYLVISTALLGFGCSGTVVSIGQRFFKENCRIILWWFSMGLTVSVPITFFLAQLLPFDQLQLVWDIRQLGYLLGYYLLLFIPFFFAGGFICTAFTAYAESSNRLYFFNMAGSGLGAGTIVILMHGHSPEQLLMIITGLSIFGALILAFKISIRLSIVTLVCGLIIFLVFGFSERMSLNIQISENKSLVYYRSLPQAKILTTRFSPLSRLDIVQAPAIRSVPGLSIGYQGDIPEQSLLIIDADASSTINHFDHIEELKCFDYVTSALPYHLISNPKVCIIGTGGGSDVAQALFFTARQITAVEMDPEVITLLKGNFADLASGIFHRPEVNTVISEGRNFLQTTNEKFDIIQISLLDSSAASVAGLCALNESHLYTVEAVGKSLDRLSDGGLLSITRTLKSPPRDSLKILATVKESLLRRGVAEPSEHVIMIRSWATATIIVSPQLFKQSSIAKVRKFCQQKRFDPVYFSHIREEDVNRFHVLQEPYYYMAAKEIFSKDAEKFYDDYPYYIRPATDNKPYFFDFLKLRTLVEMIRTMPGMWLPYSEWGYLILLVTLVQAICVSALFILLPLFLAKPIRLAKKAKLATSMYFLFLGLAYMFLETGFIQKMTLLMGDPIYGVAITLVGFLVFSGCGSLFGVYLARRPVNRISLAISAIIVVGLLEIILLDVGFDWLISFSRFGRIGMGLVICAPLAFFMGIPFPTALTALNKHNSPLVPWSWGINGFASVTAAVLGTCLAVTLGFTLLVMTALGCYFLAALISAKVCRGT